jgi:hypothetical protein
LQTWLIWAEISNRPGKVARISSARRRSVRRILVDRARQKLTLKRGGNLERVDLDRWS